MRVLAMVLLVVGGVSVLHAPVGAQGHANSQPRGGDPVEMLLAIGVELELSSDQVTRLRRIQARLEERNRPLVDRLVEVQRRVQANLIGSDSSGGSSRRPSREQMEIARAPLRQIRVNNMEAMEDVGRVLTRAQKRMAAELLDLPGVDRRWRRDRRRPR